MTIKARGETLDVLDQVNLIVQFKDQNGAPIDTDSYPTISITQPSGHVLFAGTSAGVARVSTGRYSYIFTIPLTGPYGIFNDNWVGLINGIQVTASFSFVVVKTDVPGINSDGYVHLGDIFPLTYSQTSIQNINKLLRILKARLNSSGKAPRTINGNLTYVDCDIFSTDTLVSLLGAALSDFNQVPYFTAFTFDESDFVTQFTEILVEGATLYALSSQALIEKGREFQFTDNSINFNPPSMGEMLNTQYSTLLTHYWEKLKYIKNSLRPGPKGLGVFGMTSGLNPAVARLRHLRQRRVI